MDTNNTPGKEPANWQQLLEQGDEDSFEKLIEPYVPELTRAAQHSLDYYIAQGHIQRDTFSAEEVVGETLVRAWEHRQRRPSRMTLRAWLHSVQYRVVRGMVEQEREYQHGKLISLDEPIPVNENEDAVGESFWEWYQWDASLEWEDIIPGQKPVDHEVPLFDTKETLLLDQEKYHVLMMHDEFEMSLPDVAVTLDRAINEIAEVLSNARADLRQRVADTPDDAEIDHPPAPDDIS